MKILIAASIVLVISSVYLIRQSGYNPKPILVMKASEYKTEADLGKALFRRFFKEAQTINNFYVFCESDQCGKLTIWRSFLENSDKNGLKKRNIITHSELNFNFSNNRRDTNFSLNLYPLSEQSQVVISQNSLIFYMVDFYINENQEQPVSGCETIDSFKNFDCLASSYSKRFYKKKI